MKEFVTANQMQMRTSYSMPLVRSHWSVQETIDFAKRENESPVFNYFKPNPHVVIYWSKQPQTCIPVQEKYKFKFCF